jgi:archaemetzincin
MRLVSMGVFLAALTAGDAAVAGTAGPRAGRPEDGPAPFLTVVPLGRPGSPLVKLIAGSIRRRFCFEVRLGDAVSLPAAAWYAPRRRWRAEKLLDFLDSLPALSEAWRVVGLTEAPISTTKGRHQDWGIAGLGRLGGKSSILTAHIFRRLRARSPRLYRRYLENLVLHEVGHTLRVDHCPLDRCIMADAKGNAIRAARRSLNQFCPRCTHLLHAYLRYPTVRGAWSARERALLEKLPRAPLPSSLSK